MYSVLRSSLDHFTGPDGDKYQERPHRGLEKWKGNQTHYDGYSDGIGQPGEEAWIDEHAAHDGAQTKMLPTEFDYRQYLDSGEMAQGPHGRPKGPDPNFQPVPHPHYDINKDLGDAQHIQVRNTPTWQSSIFADAPGANMRGIGHSKRPDDHNVLNVAGAQFQGGLNCASRPIDHDMLGQNENYGKGAFNPISNGQINPSLGKHGGFSEGLESVLHSVADPQDVPHKPYIQNPGFGLERTPPRVTRRFEHSIPDHDVLH